MFVCSIIPESCEKFIVSFLFAFAIESHITIERRELSVNETASPHRCMRSTICAFGLDKLYFLSHELLVRLTGCWLEAPK